MISLHSQDYFLSNFFSNDSVLNLYSQELIQQVITVNDLENLFKKRIRYDNESGIWFSKIEIVDISKDTDNKGIKVNANYKSGKRLLVDSILIKSENEFRYDLIGREIYFFKGMAINQKILDKMQRQSSSSYFITEIKSFQFSQNDSVIYMYLETDALNRKFANAILSYSDDEKSIQYDVDLEFENLGGSGRNIAFKYQKLTKRNEDYYLRYFEAFFLNSYFHINADLQQIVLDSLYTQWNYGLSIEYPVSNNIRLEYALRFRNISPIDSTVALSQFIPQTHRQSHLAKVIYQNLYPFRVPREGMEIRFEFTVSQTEILGPNFLITQFPKLNFNSQKLQINFKYYYPLSSLFQFAHSSKWNQSIDEADKFSGSEFIGGFRSLRGYRDKQFSLLDFHLHRSEFRWQNPSDNRIYLFFDQLYSKENMIDNWIYSYGFGMQFKLPLGFLSVDYAIPKSVSFKQAVIHFGLIGSLEN